MLFPNIRSGILAAAFLTLALSLGEYTFASLILPSTPTFPVFLASVVTTSTYYAVALSVIALIVTWGLLVAISVIGSGAPWFGRGRRRGRRGTSIRRRSVAADRVGGMITQEER